MRRTLLAATALLPLAACASGAHENLNGTAWMQTSAEYQMACIQTFAAAGGQLDQALRDPGWTAALEQEGDPDGLTPAIIFDVDETVLDNSPFQARLVLADADFQPELWDAWCQEAVAEAIPGAQEFIQAAQQRGVEVFFVTNRDVRHEAVTVANLQQRVDPTVTAARVLCKNENGWSSDKTARRAEVARGYRILMLFGDDYSDFAWLGRGTGPEERRRAAQEHRERWGTRWFLLPNPTYGSWERALWSHDDDPDRAEKLARREQALRTR